MEPRGQVCASVLYDPSMHSNYTKLIEISLLASSLQSPSLLHTIPTKSRLLNGANHQLMGQFKAAAETKYRVEYESALDQQSISGKM